MGTTAVDSRSRTLIISIVSKIVILIRSIIVDALEDFEHLSRKEHISNKSTFLLKIAFKAS